MRFCVPELDLPRRRDKKGSVGGDADGLGGPIVPFPTLRQRPGDNVPLGEKTVFAATEQLRPVRAPAEVVDAGVGVPPDEAVVKLSLGEAVEEDVARVRSPSDQVKRFDGDGFGGEGSGEVGGRIDSWFLFLLSPSSSPSLTHFEGRPLQAGTERSQMRLRSVILVKFPGLSVPYFQDAVVIGVGVEIAAEGELRSA